jgi:hypothetical protein
MSTTRGRVTGTPDNRYITDISIPPAAAHRIIRLPIDPPMASPEAFSPPGNLNSADAKHGSGTSSSELNLDFPSVPTHKPGKYDDVIKKIDDELVEYLQYLKEQFVRNNLFREGAWNSQPKHEPIFEETGLTWEKRASEKINENAIYQFGEKEDAQPEKIHGLSVAFINVGQANPDEKQLKVDLVKKFNAVQHLRALLNHPTTSKQENLRVFYQEACLPENPMLKHRSTSKYHALFRDAYWKRITLNCAAILAVVPGIALAIHSRFFTPKKSWNFTAFKGDIVVQNIKAAAKPFLKTS